MKLEFPDNDIMYKAVAGALLQMTAKNIKTETAPEVVINTPEIIDPEDTLDKRLEDVNAVNSNAPAIETFTEFDCNGVKWDERIHSRNKTLMKNGAWKPKRGVTPELVKSVLEKQNTTPAMAVADLPAKLTEDVTIETVKPKRTVPKNFTELMPVLTAANLGTKKMKEACVSVGLEGPQQLISRPDVYGQLLNYLGL